MARLKSNLLSQKIFCTLRALITNIIRKVGNVMKFVKFVQTVGEWKFVAAMYFMMSMLLATIVVAFYGMWEFSTITIWQIFAVSSIGSLLHYIYFTNWKLPAKIITHILSVFALIFVSALICGWSFVTNSETIFQFIVIYIILYGAAAFGWSIYYKAESM